MRYTIGVAWNSMRLSRIVAVPTMALLLSVSSLAAACDLSCEFVQFESDCHSTQMVHPSAAMTMAGMSMPEMNGGNPTGQQVFSSTPSSMPTHAAFVDMGSCKRQSCDQAQTLTSRVSHSTAAQFESIRTIAGFSNVNVIPPAFHEARDDTSLLDSVVHFPLSVALRI
jgi:hypothetical protein